LEHRDAGVSLICHIRKTFMFRARTFLWENAENMEDRMAVGSDFFSGGVLIPVA
jgi:hypothetical protein